MSLPHVPFVTHYFVWRGIAVEVRYTPSWLDFFEAIYGRPLPLMEVISQFGEPLPITQTGYTSHFPAPGNVEAHGGPVDYVMAWLDHEADQPGWKEREAAARQFNLF